MTDLAIGTDVDAASTLVTRKVVFAFDRLFGTDDTIPTASVKIALQPASGSARIFDPSIGRIVTDRAPAVFPITDISAIETIPLRATTGATDTDHIRADNGEQCFYELTVAIDYGDGPVTEISGYRLDIDSGSPADINFIDLLVASADGGVLAPGTSTLSATALAAIAAEVSTSGFALPTGGTDGQILGKTAAGEEWKDDLTAAEKTAVAALIATPPALAGDLSAESTARSSADAALDTRVDDLEAIGATTYDDTVVTAAVAAVATDLTTEETARANADTALDTRVTDNATAITAIQAAEIAGIVFSPILDDTVGDDGEFQRTADGALYGPRAAGVYPTTPVVPAGSGGTAVATTTGVNADPTAGLVSAAGNVEEKLVDAGSRINLFELTKTVAGPAALGVGVDDTASLQAFIDAHQGYTIILHANYLRDPNVELLMRANTHLVLHGSISCSVASTDDDYSMIRCEDIANFSITGPGTITGDRAIHVGTTGEHGHGIRLLGCSSFTIGHGLLLEDCWGDGVYVGPADPGGVNTPCSDFWLESYKTMNCRRQGTSVTHADRFQIARLIGESISGADPQAALDLEPNAGGYVRNGTVTDILGVNCGGPAVALYSATIGLLSGIEVSGVVAKDCKYGVAINRALGCSVTSVNSEGATEFGIWIANGGKDVYVRPGTITGSVNKGIAASQGTYENCVIDGGLVVESGREALYIDRADGIEVKNGTYGKGATVAGAYTVWVDASAEVALISNHFIGSENGGTTRTFRTTSTTDLKRRFNVIESGAFNQTGDTGEQVYDLVNNALVAV